jgi:hypothetical protein
MGSWAYRQSSAAALLQRRRHQDLSDDEGVFGMALPQTTGFVESLLRLIGLDWSVPDFSTLSRRHKARKVNIPYRGSDGPLHLLIDSTGIKVEGAREWNASKHGGSKLRVTDYNTTRPSATRPPQASPCTCPPQSPDPLHAMRVPRAGRLLNTRQLA